MNNQLIDAEFFCNSEPLRILGIQDLFYRNVPPTFVNAASNALRMYHVDKGASLLSILAMNSNGDKSTMNSIDGIN